MPYKEYLQFLDDFGLEKLKQEYSGIVADHFAGFAGSFNVYTCQRYIRESGDVSDDEMIATESVSGSESDSEGDYSAMLEHDKIIEIINIESMAYSEYPHQFFTTAKYADGSVKRRMLFCPEIKTVLTRMGILDNQSSLRDLNYVRNSHLSTSLNRGNDFHVFPSLMIDSEESIFGEVNWAPGNVRRAMEDIIKDDPKEYNIDPFDISFKFLFNEEFDQLTEFLNEQEIDITRVESNDRPILLYYVAADFLLVNAMEYLLSHEFDSMYEQRRILKRCIYMAIRGFERNPDACMDILKLIHQKDNSLYKTIMVDAPHKMQYYDFIDDFKQRLNKLSLITKTRTKSIKNSCNTIKGKVGDKKYTISVKYLDVSLGVFNDFPPDLQAELTEYYINKNEVYGSFPDEIIKMIFHVRNKYEVSKMTGPNTDGTGIDQHLHQKAITTIQDILYDVKRTLLSAPTVAYKTRYWNSHLLCFMPLLGDEGIPILKHICTLYYENAQDHLMFGLSQYDPKTFLPHLREIILLWKGDECLELGGTTNVDGQMFRLIGKYQLHGIDLLNDPVIAPVLYYKMRRQMECILSDDSYTRPTKMDKALQLQIQVRANEFLYKPGASGYEEAMAHFGLLLY